jgi:hypothetical protein
VAHWGRRRGAIRVSPFVGRPDDFVEPPAIGALWKGQRQGRDPESASTKAQLDALPFSFYASASAADESAEVIACVANSRRSWGILRSQCTPPYIAT